MFETVNGHGESQWIREAVALYERRLLLYANHLLGPSAAASGGGGDLVQETFCRLCRANREDVEDHLAQWLFTVCRNLATDVLRKDTRMRPAPELLEPVAPAQPPGAVIENRESYERILRALGELPKNQQEVVRLKFQHAMSYKEIAKVTGLSVTNVGFILHTALKTVREQLSTEDAAGHARRA